MYSLIALIVGVIGLAVGFWLRRDTDKNRFWVRRPGFVDERIVFFFVPGFSAVLLGMGLVQVALLATGVATSIILTLAMIIALAGFIGVAWALLPLPYPKRILPPWARRAVSDLKAGKIKRKPVRRDWNSKARRHQVEVERQIRQEKRERRRAERAARANRYDNRKKRRPR